MSGLPRSFAHMSDKNRDCRVGRTNVSIVGATKGLPRFVAPMGDRDRDRCSGYSIDVARNVNAAARD